jgi:hypothetical protein
MEYSTTATSRQDNPSLTHDETTPKADKNVASKGGLADEFSSDLLNIMNTFGL